MTQHENYNNALAEQFERWMAGENLSEKELTELQMHPEWSERMMAVESMNRMAALAEQEIASVPKWDRDSAFNTYLKKPKWWQTQGLSVAAMCFSVFACMLLVFDVRVAMGPDGVRIASTDTMQRIELERKFNELARENNLAIQTRLDNFQAQQQQSTAQLVNYVLNSSRTERKEDIQDVVEVLQQQRESDMLFLRDQFKDVNYNLRMAKLNADQNNSASQSEAYTE
jgi:hypothetical protein